MGLELLKEDTQGVCVDFPVSSLFLTTIFCFNALEHLFFALKRSGIYRHYMRCIKFDIDRIGFINCCAADNPQCSHNPQTCTNSDFMHNRAQLLIKPGELDCGLPLDLLHFSCGVLIQDREDEKVTESVVF